ncbi:MAG: hypothetical protein KKD44_20410 [Proteobacteria bacterium]|nr:hypothetical protein [Pseudomonadota bacterium]
MMKKTFRLYQQLAMMVLLAALVSGCNSSTHVKETGTPITTVSDPQTGDVSLFPNSTLLASAKDIQDNPDGLILIDTRSGDAYAAGHIPGAISMDWKEYVLWNDPPQKAVLKSVANLESALGNKGLTRLSHIVIYDDTVTSWGSAGRIFWMLETLGCTHVRILNGGWDKWITDGLGTETTASTLDRAKFEADLTLFSGNSVDKAYIKSRLSDDDFAVVDTRTDAEYIGWKLYGEARGGHIPGAVQLPYESYYNADHTLLGYDDLKAMLDAHGITADKEVTAYCTAGIRSGFFYFLGRLMGFHRIANYDGSMWDWSAADEADYPMDTMAHYQALVSPSWLDTLIKGEETPETFPAGQDYVILFTSYAARYSENRTDYVGTPYETGHIPGAIFLDTYSIENGPSSEYGDGYQSPEEGNAKPIADLQDLFGSLGIAHDTTVIVYADDEISMMTAGRVAWSLLLAGVEDVRVLNGNFKAWVAYGGATETAVNVLDPVAFGHVPGRADVLADMDDLNDVIDGTTPDALIVDDREWAEYVGSSNSYYPYFSEYGRIPTAQWIGDWVKVVSDDMQFLKSPYAVDKDWRDAGFTPAKTMYFYCGTGWRSGLYTFYAYLMGWPAANFDGGWFQWSSVEGNDRETGNSDKLVTASWVKTMVDTENDGNPYVIVETGWGQPPASYLDGHIQGAIWVNTDEIEYDCFNARNDWPVDEGYPACMDRSTTEEEDLAKGLGPDDALPRNWWNIYPDRYLLPAITNMGIDKNTTVVVYGKGGSAAARVLWTLMYAGVSDVRFLNGGKTAWTSAGYTLETGSVTRTPVDFFDPDDQARDTALHPEYKVDIPYVRDVVNGVYPDDVLVDIRSQDEFIGASRPYRYIPTDGRVPGAVWGTDDFTNTDGTLVSPAEIYPYWRSLGITQRVHSSYYCGTAWRSSLAWFYAYLMGYPDISNFDSSWFEWSMGLGSDYNGDDPVLNPIEDDSPTLPELE